MEENFFEQPQTKRVKRSANFSARTKVNREALRARIHTNVSSTTMAFIWLYAIYSHLGCSWCFYYCNSYFDTFREIISTIFGFNFLHIFLVQATSVRKTSTFLNEIRFDLNCFAFAEFELRLNMHVLTKNYEQYKKMLSHSPGMASCWDEVNTQNCSLFWSVFTAWVIAYKRYAIV